MRVLRACLGDSQSVSRWTQWPSSHLKGTSRGQVEEVPQSLVDFMQVLSPGQNLKPDGHDI